MNSGRDKERLLADVLAGEEAAAFREALLAETLGQVRRRRRSRQAWRAALALAIVAGLSALLWRSPRPVPVGPGGESRGYEVVLSRPLPGSALVNTRPFVAGVTVASPDVQIVQTTSSRAILRDISDSELLALVAPKPAALVRSGQHRAELVFVNPEDGEELVRN